MLLPSDYCVQLLFIIFSWFMFDHDKTIILGINYFV